MEAEACTSLGASYGESNRSRERLEPEKQFIRTYESLTQLWDTTDFRYSNRLERHKALNVLLPIYRRVKPYATINDVKKRINSIRSNYRRELKKYIALERAGKTEAYYPKVWYFPYLKFLKKTERHLDLPELQYACEENSVTPKQEERASHNTEIDTTETPYVEDTLAEPARKPVSEKTHADVGPRGWEPHPCRVAHPIALEWAGTLKRLHPLQRLYAKKAINDILFEAELGNLNQHSVQINEATSYYLHSPVHTLSEASHPQSSPSEQADPIFSHRDDLSSDVDYKVRIPISPFGNNGGEAQGDAALKSDDARKNSDV